MSVPIKIPSIGLSHINNAAKSDIDAVNVAISIIDELLVILKNGKIEYPDNILIQQLLKNYQERKVFLNQKLVELRTFIGTGGSLCKRSTRKRSTRKRSTRKRSTRRK
jgi:hypothetical protein